MVSNAFMEDEEVQALTESVMQCPECKSKNVAWIFYGYPGDMEWYLEAVAKKEIAPGGCTVTDHDPKWRCNDCYHGWGKREDD